MFGFFKTNITDIKMAFTFCLCRLFILANWLSVGRQVKLEANMLPTLTEDLKMAENGSSRDTTPGPEIRGNGIRRNGFRRNGRTP